MRQFNQHRFGSPLLGQYHHDIGGDGTDLRNGTEYFRVEVLAGGKNAHLGAQQTLNRGGDVVALANRGRLRHRLLKRALFLHRVLRQANCDIGSEAGSKSRAVKHSAVAQDDAASQLQRPEPT